MRERLAHWLKPMEHSTDRIQGQPDVCNKFQASKSYMMRPYPVIVRIPKFRITML